MNQTPKRLFLIDAYAIIYRAFHIFRTRPRRDSKGRDTGAIFGFLNSLHEILENQNPELIAVAFDLSGGTFRHEIYPAYKANRDETPEAIRFAVPHIREILQALRIPIVECQGYEADDVIGTIATKASKAGLEVYMVTPDKDYAQLVDERTYMYRPQKGGGYEVWDIVKVIESFGVRHPEQIVDYLALIGDSSDNYPGCPGIGPAKASKLLSSYESIDDIYAHLGELKAKERQLLEDGKELTRLSRQLAEIVRSVPLEIELDTLLRQHPDTDRVRSLYEELELMSLISRVGRLISPENEPEDKQGSSKEEQAEKPLVPTQAIASSTEELSLFDGLEEASRGDITLHHEAQPLGALQWKWIDSPQELEELMAQALELGCIAFDTETSGTNVFSDGLIVVSFALSEDMGYSILVPQDLEEARRSLEPLKRVLSSPEVLKIGHNIKFDLQMLHRYGVEVSLPMFDTMLAHYLLFPDLRHGLDRLSESYLGIRPMSFEEMLHPQTPKNFDLRAVAPDRLGFYASEDAVLTYRLQSIFASELEKREQNDLFYKLEMPLVPVLARMERAGVRLDVSKLNQLSEVLEGQMHQIEEDIHTLVGKMINPASSKQVGELLFGDLDLGTGRTKKTKTGAYSTSEEALEKLYHKHPVVPLILEHRKVKKLLSTYIKPLPGLLHADGKLHSTFNQAVAATGRLSSSDPNIQNIPIRTPEGQGIREAFVADGDGFTFLSADYSQIELRLMASMSGDEALIEAFRSGEDVHTSTAAKVYHVPLEEVTAEMRRKAKTANFGIIYGISTFGLSERLRIDFKEAKELIDGYFRSYPTVQKYMQDVVAQATKDGYVSTLLGRRRYLPDLNSSNQTERGYAERNAINAPIQGTAADIIKLAMIRIDEELQRRGLRSQMILQVHDELNFNVAVEEEEEVRQIVFEGMTQAFTDLAVPLVVEMGSGDNWLVAH